MKKYLLLPLAGICLAAGSAHCQETYMRIEGSTTAFRPESMNKGHTDATELLGVSFEATSPRDPATGLASGRRQYQPLIVYKESGASSPQFFDAMMRNQSLKKVTIEVYLTDRVGMQVLGSVITLENVHVSFFRQQLGVLNANSNRDRMKSSALYDEIRFVFEKVTIEYKPAGTMATDSWNSLN